MIKQKLGLLVATATVVTAALIPLAVNPAGATTAPGPINTQVTDGPPGSFMMCFGMKATITDAKTTFRWVHEDAVGNQVTPYKSFGGPKQLNLGAHHKGTLNVYYGTPGNDVIIGTGGMDLIYGNGGHDRICALDGNDVVFVGASGGDPLTDSPGWDQVDGGRGNDNLFGGNITNDGLSFHAYGGPGNDIIGGGPGADYLDAGIGTNMVNGFDNVDQCFSGTKNANTVGNEDWDFYLQYDTPAPRDFNCELNAKGRAWTNHAIFYVPAPVTTTTTSH